MSINTNTLIWIIIAWLMIIFFAGIEIAFANANRLTIEIKKKQGLQRSILLSGFLNTPSRFISALLIGFNLFLVIFGLLVGETLSPAWEYLIKKTAVPQAWVDIFRLMFETFTSAHLYFFFRGTDTQSIFSGRKATACWISLHRSVISFTIYFTRFPVFSRVFRNGS